MGFRKSEHYWEILPPITRTPLPCLNQEPEEAILASIKITLYPFDDANSYENLYIERLQ